MKGNRLAWSVAELPAGVDPLVSTLTAPQLLIQESFPSVLMLILENQHHAYQTRFPHLCCSSPYKRRSLFVESDTDFALHRSIRFSLWLSKWQAPPSGNSNCV